MFIKKHLLMKMPMGFEVEYERPMVMYGACIEVDTHTGKALKIERISIVDENIQIVEK